jgi:phosphoserine phosphatase
MSIAFFDLDGTLLRHPSLERRLFWNLFRRGKIPAASCLRWLAQSVRLGPWNFRAISQMNKAYLHGVPLTALENSPFLLPDFFPAAIQRVWWHALRGDTIALVTGTLAPLAHTAKLALERETRWRGVEANICVFATQLEVKNASCTGNVRGAPMFSQQKAHALAEFAAVQGSALRDCFAYGDHYSDRWMLDAAGKPFAVNPSAALRRLALGRGWPVLNWHPCSSRTLLARNAFKWKGEAAR